MSSSKSIISDKLIELILYIFDSENSSENKKYSVENIMITKFVKNQFIY